MEKLNKPNSTDEYIQSFPPKTQVILEALREKIKEAAPGAEEVISYQMPAFRLNGIVVYFGGHKDHIGLYPTASGVEVFKKELADYKYSKGAIQFPIDKPMPYDLITRIVKYRVKENLEKATRKKSA
jgi:uncharacterized protein YdhG (YjbR/CyaY superfamily)